MRKVAILTTFFECESGYSLIAVVETQIKMLLEHGYDPAVVVRSDFKRGPVGSIWRDAMINLMPILPAMDITSGIPPTFEDDVQKLTVIYQTYLSDFDVIITHDIILQEYYKRHNIAFRRYSDTHPEQLFLHWIHSCPNPVDPIPPYPLDCRYTPIPGYIVYPNDSDRDRVAESYQMPLERVIANRASHAIDPLTVWNYAPLTCVLADRCGMLKAEVCAVYPTRLDRGKQPEKIIRLLAGVKDYGLSVNLLIVDWQSQGSGFQTYINRLLGLARQLGLEGQVNFTSRLDDRAAQGVGRRVVSELLDLSSV